MYNNDNESLNILNKAFEDKEEKFTVTLKLLKASAIEISRLFSDDKQLLTAALDVVSEATRLSQYSYEYVDLSNTILDKYRNLVFAVYNKIMKSNPATSLIYFKTSNIRIQMNAINSDQDLAIRTLLILGTVMGMLVAMYKTGDQEFMKNINTVRNSFAIIGGSSPIDKYGDGMLIKMMALLFVAKEENKDSILSKIQEMFDSIKDLKDNDPSFTLS